MATFFDSLSNTELLEICQKRVAVALWAIVLLVAINHKMQTDDVSYLTPLKIIGIEVSSMENIPTLLIRVSLSLNGQIFSISTLSVSQQKFQ